MDNLLALLTDIFPAIDFNTEDKLITDRRLDSLALLVLIKALERKYEITIPWEEITVENFDSAGVIYALLQRLKA